MTDINEATLQDGSQTLLPLCIPSTQLQNCVCVKQGMPCQNCQKKLTGGCKNQGKNNEVRKGMSEEKLISVDSDIANQLTVRGREKKWQLLF